MEKKLKKEINQKKESRTKIHENMGLRITELRVSHQMSQSDVVEELSLRINYELSNKTFSKYENGNCSLPYDILMHLADIYETSVSYIVTGKEDDIWCSKLKCEELLECAQKIIKFFETLSLHKLK